MAYFSVTVSTLRGYPFEARRDSAIFVRTMDPSVNSLTIRRCIIFHNLPSSLDSPVWNLILIFFLCWYESNVCDCLVLKILNFITQFIMYGSQMQAVRDLYEIVPTWSWQPDEKRRTQIVFIGVYYYAASYAYELPCVCGCICVVKL